MILTVFIFWFSIFAIFYAYFGYPMILWMIAQFKPKNFYPACPVRSNDRTGVKCFNLFNRGNEPIKPTVSFIITAYNEKQRIAEKIENTLNQDYPKDSLEIIVASDCSTDGTDEIVKSYESKGVRLVRAPERKGKENAQKYAIENSTGYILVFADVGTMLQPDAVSNIVKNFQDLSIGCVSSEDRLLDRDGNVSGESAYVRYEMFLRRLESKVNTLVGLSGSFFAARREVCKDWAIDLQSDFNTLLNCARLGLRGISDPSSIGYYKDIADEKKEFERKVRTVLRGISVFMKNRSLLNPFHYGLFSWQLFSHKLCRWLVPFFLLLAFITNFFLIFHDFFYYLLFIMQVTFYFLAFVYYKNPAKAEGILKVPYFFVSVNYSILVAWIEYLRGKRLALWNPSQR